MTLLSRPCFHFKDLAFINTLAEWERLCGNVGSTLSWCIQKVCVAGRMGTKELGCWSGQPDDMLGLRRDGCSGHT